MWVTSGFTAITIIQKPAQISAFEVLPSLILGHHHFLPGILEYLPTCLHLIHRAAVRMINYVTGS